MRSFVLILVHFLILSLFGCNDREDLKELSGDICGYVHIYDMNAQLYNDHSGVTITLTNFDQTIAQDVFSDINGKYYLRIFPMGCIS